MAPRCITREDFLKEYIFPIEPARDFERNDILASFASGHPKDWGFETWSFNFSRDLESYGNPTYKSYHSAVSPDKKLLAISSASERILVYDIATKELRQVLEGAGSIIFRPLAGDQACIDSTEERDVCRHGTPVYSIISSISDEAFRGSRNNNKLTLWELDQHGRLLDEEEPIDPDSFATKAINAIMPELEANHEWTRDFINSSTLHAQFAQALNKVASDHRRRHNTVINNARLGSFGSTAFSTDGKLFLYHSSSKLPEVVLYDLDEGKEIHRLSGHTDAIMWSAISPDSQYIASVSWDGTLRMYSVCTGDLLWCTQDSGGQSWAGAFSPDSKYIVWSSKSGRLVQVHNVVDGQTISTLQETFQDWCRCLKWHPVKHQIALCVGKHAYVWEPFNGTNGSILQHFEIPDSDGWRSMVSIQTANWMDQGRLLYLETSEGTKLVYDTETNSKELFRRPHGVDSAWVGHGFYGLFHEDTGNYFYLSVDGDGKVRYWRDSVPVGPSWWEKEREISVTEKSEKKSFPETGKYVKITKKSPKAFPRSAAERESWAEKGAEIWTAE
ncbi:WD40 repeat-like protein [Pyrenochaeta sp. DS3sAY3a]|nr:WD40 repeat-like protein [Pyrenochaeta sp. DS3sAY3a]